MKIKYKMGYAFGIIVLALFLLSSCEKEPIVPDTVPIKAEIKQVIVKNSIFKSNILDDVSEDMDTIELTVPQGTDITTLDLDIIYSYFGAISPEPGITDLTNPVIYTVKTNFEERDIMIMVNVVPPAISTFLLTSPVEVVGKIEGDSVILEILEGINLSEATFVAEFFGERVEPEMTKSIDLTVENPVLKVINKEFETTYSIIVDYYKIIEFTGSLYDGTLHPNDFLLGSVQEDEMEGWVVEENPGAYQESVVHFTSIGEKGTDGHNGQADFVYGGMGLEADPDETTTVFRVKGIPNDGENNFLEIAFKLNESRAKFYIEVDNLEIKGGEEVKWKFADEPDNTFDPTQWNTYRITCNKVTNEIKLYLNEDPEPKIVDVLYNHGGAAEVKVGDGGSNYYECLIDYFAFEADGAYSPEDLPLSKIIK